MHAPTFPTPAKNDPSRGPVVVLGGGIAGLSAADQLSRAGLPVVLLEATDQLGGGHRSVDIGPYTFDVGSIFYEEASRVFDLAEGLREMCPQVRRIQRRITPEGTLSHYPIEPRDLLRWPKPRLARALVSLAVARAIRRRDGTLEGACVARLGRPFFAETGLRDYTIRFNGQPPDEIDEEFYDKRMGFIHRATDFGALTRSAWRALRKQQFQAAPRRPLHVRPRAGYAPLFNRIRDQLEARGVEIHLNAPVEEIVTSGDGPDVVAGGRRIAAGAVVAAMPLDTVSRALFGEGTGLASLDLLTLFVSADHLDENTGNVLFNFHRNGDWKRATIYSRLYPDATQPRAFFAVEKTLPPGASADPEQSFAQVKAQLEGLGIAHGMRLEGSTVTASAYPIYRPGQMNEARAVLEKIKARGVIPVGRQGRFEYLPTASGVVRRTIEELESAGLTVR